MTLVSSDASLLITKITTCDWDIKANPVLNVFELNIEDTDTVTLSGLGTVLNPLTADVKISSDPDNQLVIDAAGGLLVLPGSFTNTDENIKITNQDTTAGYLNSKVVAGTGITKTVLNPGANEQIEFALDGSFLETVAVADTNEIDLSGDGTLGNPILANIILSANADNILSVEADGLYAPAMVETDVVVVDTDSINLTAGGTANHTLQADVNISATANNLISIEADGLLALETALVATDTSSIDFTTSGTAGHALTAAVKISATAGNILSVNADGLYVSAVAPTDATNGLTLDGDDVILGGTLDRATTVDTTGFTMSFIKTGNINNASQVALGGSLTIEGAVSTETNQYPYNGLYGGLGFNKTVSTTLHNHTLASGVLGIIVQQNTGAILGTGTPAGVTGASLFASTGNLARAASVVAMTPKQDDSGAAYTGTITDYYGLYVYDITGGSDITARITNKWGVYQEGTSDKNYFGGSSRFVKGIQMESMAGDPTTSEIPASHYGVWKNSTSGDVKLWVNDGGVMKSVALV